MVPENPKSHDPVQGLPGNLVQKGSRSSRMVSVLEVDHITAREEFQNERIATFSSVRIGPTINKLQGAIEDTF